MLGPWKGCTITDVNDFSTVCKVVRLFKGVVQ